MAAARWGPRQQVASGSSLLLRLCDSVSRGRALEEKAPRSPFFICWDDGLGGWPWQSEKAGTFFSSLAPLRKGSPSSALSTL